MPLNQKTLNNVLILTAEVAALAATVDEERKSVQTRNYEEPTGSDPGGWTWGTEERFEHPGYTKASAALKRRSMDLTRVSERGDRHAD